MCFLFLLFWRNFMIKVLVAEKHTKENHFLCEKLSENPEIQTISSISATQTLDMYHNLEPQILILNAKLNDMPFMELMDRLSSSTLEKNKCNILVTFDNPEEINSLNHFSKIWKTFKKPFDFSDLAKTIHDMKTYLEIPILTETELDAILLNLNFHLGADGTKYMKTAIMECYYDKSLFHTLDDIYAIVAKIKNKTVKEIRDGMRSSIVPLNKYGCFSTEDNILRLLTLSDSIGVKFFLEVLVTYLHEIKNKNE